MSLAVGFGQVYNEETGRYEEVLISTKASEIIFNDGQTLQYKLESGQLNGKDGKNGADGKDGTNGKDGKDGVNGKDGRDGKDGTSAASSAQSNALMFYRIGSLTYRDAAIRMCELTPNYGMAGFNFLGTDMAQFHCWGIWFREWSNGIGVFCCVGKQMGNLDVWAMCWWANKLTMIEISNSVVEDGGIRRADEAIVW